MSSVYATEDKPVLPLETELLRGRRHDASTHLNILEDNTAEVATYLFLAAVFHTIKWQKP